MSLLLAPPAWAGYYQLTSQTGGLLTYKDATFPTQYSATPYGYGAMGNANEWADCSGQITTFFEWHSEGPGDDPPKQVIIRESCSASWFGYGVSSPASGVADNGLGFAEVPTGPVPVYDGSGNLEYWEGGGDASGTRYRIEAGKQTVKVTCSPRASTDGGSGGYAEVSLFYSADVYPVVVTLTGTTPDQKNILIGQGCTATLSAGPATLSNYQWSVPGLTFAAFDVDPSHVPPHWGNPRYVFDEYTKPNPQWFWRKDEQVTVSCTADASIDGKSIGTVTGERQVTIWAPYYIFKNIAGPVSVGNPFGSLEVYAGGPAAEPPGMNFGGRVGTPDMFRSQGDGIWQFIQIIYPGRWIYNYVFGVSVEHSLNWNGYKALDNHYPYDSVRNSPLPPWPADSVDMSPASNEPTYWAEDIPGEGLNDVFYRARIDESFEDFMMYLPPNSGNGSEWVPLHKLRWKWQADISRTGATWAGGWSPAPPGYVTDLSSERCTEHPWWQYLLTNGDMHY